MTTSTATFVYRERLLKSLTTIELRFISYHAGLKHDQPGRDNVDSLLANWDGRPEIRRYVMLVIDRKIT